jgi:hypothetical protein
VSREKRNLEEKTLDGADMAKLDSWAAHQIHSSCICREQVGGFVPIVEIVDER